MSPNSLLPSCPARCSPTLATVSSCDRNVTVLQRSYARPQHCSSRYSILMKYERMGGILMYVYACVRVRVGMCVCVWVCVCVCMCACGYVRAYVHECRLNFPLACRKFCANLSNRTKVLCVCVCVVVHGDQPWEGILPP